MVSFDILPCAHAFFVQINNYLHPYYYRSFQTLERMSKDFSPEADFAARRMTEEDFPGRYPYREFGLKYWEATHTWVKEYLDVSEGLVLGAAQQR